MIQIIPISQTASISSVLRLIHVIFHGRLLFPPLIHVQRVLIQDHRNFRKALALLQFILVIFKQFFNDILEEQKCVFNIFNNK